MCHCCCACDSLRQSAPSALLLPISLPGQALHYACCYMTIKRAERDASHAIMDDRSGLGNRLGCDVAMVAAAACHGTHIGLHCAAFALPLAACVPAVRARVWLLYGITAWLCTARLPSR